MNNKKVAIYTTPSCTYCRMTKEFFKANNVAYDEYDVAADLTRREEMFKKSNQMGVPVITIAEATGGHEDLIIGFDKGALKRSLGI